MGRGAWPRPAPAGLLSTSRSSRLTSPRSPYGCVWFRLSSVMAQLRLNSYASAKRRTVTTIRTNPVFRLSILISLVILTGASVACRAQSRLSLQDAIDKALASRASLKAEAEEVSAAQGLEKQAGLFANPMFQFENQNLRPGQTYSRDVDTYAYLTQPLDVLGKRKQRIASAQQEVNFTAAQYELARRQV